MIPNKTTETSRVSTHGRTSAFSWARLTGVRVFRASVTLTLWPPRKSEISHNLAGRLNAICLTSACWYTTDMQTSNISSPSLTVDTDIRDGFPSYPSTTMIF